MGVTVFVVGHRGMLGRVVRRYLVEQGHTVKTTQLRFIADASDPLIEEVVRSSVDVVVNCAGAVPWRISNAREMLMANALLPQYLGACLHQDQLLIHASTDGVFSGMRGICGPDDVPDATDIYGLSKRFGELARHLAPTYIIRASVVDSEGGLLQWLLEQKTDITGFTDHEWNGITTLEWARVCADLIDNRSSRPVGIEHITSRRSVTKYELLDTAARIFGVPIQVRPTVSGRPINRVLIPTITRGWISNQLEDLRAWRPTSA